MSRSTKRIIAWCLIFGVLMTLFPPQIDVITINPEDIEERMVYRFIGSASSLSFAESSIAIDRLFLQYVIIAGIGLATYFFKSSKHD